MMTNFKTTNNMIIFAFTALFISACNPTEPNPLEANTIVKTELVKAYETTTEGRNTSLVGDTTLLEKTTPLHPISTQTIDLSTLKGTNGSLKYVAIGASLTAGVRDGGWFNEGMETSYPNLIARQMGIKDFKQPLFDAKEFNGYGLKLQTKNTETPVNRYKAVSNNIAFKPSNTEMILTPYKGTELNNFAVPGLLYGGEGDLLNVNTIDNKYYKLNLKRINKDSKNIQTQIVESNSDFYSLEYLTQDLLTSTLTGEYRLEMAYYPYPETSSWGIGGAEGWFDFLHKKAKMGKGIVLNTPNIMNFPYFKKSIRFSQIKAIFDKHGLTNKDYGFDLDEKNIYFPTPTIDSLFKYQNNKVKFLNYYKSNFLKSIKGLNEEGQNLSKTLETYNIKIYPYLSKKYNIPIVDIANLYKQINEGVLINDGKKVTDKEFFSSDGINPSAYGQALIANECIKTMNAFYKTTIPLIKADYYLNR